MLIAKQTKKYLCPKARHGPDVAHVWTCSAVLSQWIQLLTDLAGLALVLHMYGHGRDTHTGPRR